MADDDSELREPVEHAADDQAQQVQAGLDGEAEDGAFESLVEHRRDQALGGRVGVEVERQVERLGGLEDRPEFGVVEVFVIDVGIDDRADEAEVLAPLQFGGGVPGVLRCDGGEGAEAVGVLLAGDGQLIVGQRGHRDRPVGRERIRTRRADRQDLAVDARGVHVGQASLPEIRQSFAHELRHAACRWSG